MSKRPWRQIPTLAPSGYKHDYLRHFIFVTPLQHGEYDDGVEV